MTVFEVSPSPEPAAVERSRPARTSTTALSPECLALYQFLVVRGGCAIDAAARDIGWNAATVRAVLAELQDTGLIEISGDTVIRLDDPWNALGRLVREEARQLEHSEAALRRVRRTRLKVLDALPELTAVQADRLSVAVLPDPGLVIDRLLREAGAAVQVMNVSRPGRPYLVEDLAAHVRRLAEHGVETCALILASRCSHAGPEFVRAGARVRTATSLPFSLLIIDERVVVCELDLDAGYPCAFLTRSRPLVDLFGSIFRRDWASAAAYHPGQDPPPAPEPADDVGLDQRERLILRMLADGMKDEVIARNVGISVRTLRRAMSRVQGRLQTRNRLETVAVAARRGLLA